MTVCLFWFIIFVYMHIHLKGNSSIFGKNTWLTAHLTPFSKLNATFSFIALFILVMLHFMHIATQSEQQHITPLNKCIYNVIWYLSTFNQNMCPIVSYMVPLRGSARLCLHVSLALEITAVCFLIYLLLSALLCWLGFVGFLWNS